jgi:hypothetical protein
VVDTSQLVEALEGVKVAVGCLAAAVVFLAMTLADRAPADEGRSL